MTAKIGEWTDEAARLRRKVEALERIIKRQGVLDFQTQCDNCDWYHMDECPGYADASKCDFSLDESKIDEILGGEE